MEAMEHEHVMEATRYGHVTHGTRACNNGGHGK